MLGLCVCALGAINVAGFIGGQFDPYLDMLTNGAPALLACGLVVATLAWTAGRKRLLVLALLVGVAPPAIPTFAEVFKAAFERSHTEGATMKVMSFNIWSRNRSVERVEQLVRSEAPDILLLQETSTKGQRDLMSRLADLYPVNVNVRPACSTRVLSRYRVLETREVRACALIGVRMELPVEQGGGDLWVFSVHLPRWPPDDRVEVSVAARELFQSIAGESVVVGGDFNSTPWSAGLRTFDTVRDMDRRTHALPTWPAPEQKPIGVLTPPLAVLPIDHVYASRDWRTVAVRVGPASGSDHRPVIVELTRAAR